MCLSRVLKEIWLSDCFADEPGWMLLEPNKPAKHFLWNVFPVPNQGVLGFLFLTARYEASNMLHNTAWQIFPQVIPKQHVSRVSVYPKFVLRFLCVSNSLKQIAAIIVQPGKPQDVAHVKNEPSLYFPSVAYLNEAQTEVPVPNSASTKLRKQTEKLVLATPFFQNH